MQGGRGHASIPKSIIKKWSGAFQVFQMTEVNHIMNPTFPLHAFLFKITSELLTADKIDNSELFGGFSFKINVKVANISGYDQVFTVMKLCDDEEVVDKNLPKNYDGNSQENGCSNSVDTFGNITNLNTNTNPDPQYTMDAREDFISNLKCKTPIKRVTNCLRSSSSSANQNEDDGQLSRNKFSRKNDKK
ncbi:hypothetical protein AHAS_Ahas11G0113700 [Arachis hypogaea]